MFVCYSSIKIRSYFTQETESKYEEDYYKQEKNWEEQQREDVDRRPDIPDEEIEKFKILCKDGDVFKPKARYQESDSQRGTLVDCITKLTESSYFPVRYRVIEIGSAKDGSKVGDMDEIDLLLELDENEIKKLEQSDKLLCKDKEYTIREFRRKFDNCLNKALSCIVPVEPQHGGDDFPHFYSGVRMNGPATTVQVKFKNCKYTTSLNITPCFSLKSIEENLQPWVSELRSMCGNRTLTPNWKPHVVAEKESFKVSTAYIEAELLYAIQGYLIHEAYIYSKRLLAMVDDFASRVYDDKENKKKNSMCNNNKHCLICSNPKPMSKVRGLVLDKRLRYEHNQLSEPNNHGELSKPHLSTNTTASKHLLLHHASNDDFQKLTDDGRIFELMKKNIKAFSDDVVHVSHSATGVSDLIFKFSCRRTSLAQYQQMVANHRELYSIVLQHFFSDVGIRQL